jgi:hypothetical protein
VKARSTHAATCARTHTVNFETLGLSRSARRPHPSRVASPGYSGEYHEHENSNVYLGKSTEQFAEWMHQGAACLKDIYAAAGRHTDPEPLLPFELTGAQQLPFVLRFFDQVV